MPTTYQSVTHRHLMAETAWQNELVRLFGKRAGDVRYTSKAHGADGSKLAELYAEYVRTRAEWYAARAALKGE